MPRRQINAKELAKDIVKEALKDKSERKLQLFAIVMKKSGKPGARKSVVLAGAEGDVNLTVHGCVATIDLVPGKGKTMYNLLKKATAKGRVITLEIA